MSNWNDDVLTGTVSQLTPVSLDERQAILDGPTANDNHRGHFDRLSVLREIEAGGAAPKRQQIDGPARVAFWNVERLRHIDAITETLRGINPDVTLLCEIDRGMARTQNTDRMVDIANRLERGYLYSVEFVELGLGDVHEQATHAGEHNAWGFHGAGLLSDVAFGAPFLIRMDDRGNWFDGVLRERRVGGTIAIGATLMVMGQAVTMVSVHLESHCDPATRGGDMAGLLEKIERVAAGGPVILGGDFNTSTAGPERWMDRAAWLAGLKDEPWRKTSPETYEPLFQVATRMGYDWRQANLVGQPTQRFPLGSDRPNHKLDWFFTRGLTATDAAIVPAVRDDGSPSSDHECLAVTVIPA